MFLFHLTPCVHLMLMHRIYSLLRLSELFSYMLATIRVAIVDEVGKGGALAIGANKEVGKDNAVDIEVNVVENLESSKLNISGSLDSISILAELYFLLYTSLSFILSVSLKALITRKLLV